MVETAIKRPQFFVGLFGVSDVQYFERAMVSINRLERRKSDFVAHDWLLDSGAFTRITTGRGICQQGRMLTTLRGGTSAGIY